MRRASTSSSTSAATRPAAVDARNDVVLVGRVAAVPAERTLPSGDSIMSARVIVDRDASAQQRSSQRVDTIDCVAWTARVQRSMRAWAAGDLVEVAGSIRRRFFRGATGPVSRVEVEVKQTKRVKTVHR
ncbi:MAG: single-stranded DNA-binding protein [Propionibacteriales bacterium]|nr:single-stranded DNA-binding protein [Propionibacteriales bacterium]